MKKSLWVSVTGYLILLLVMLPVLIVVWSSFFDSAVLSFPPSGYSFKWYTELAGQERLFNGLLYSLGLAAAASVISVTLGTISAIGLSRARLRGVGLFMNFSILPLVVPSLISGVALYIYLYSLSGLLDVQLVPTTWALLLAHVLITYPWAFRLIYAGLLSVDLNLERASLDLGRNRMFTLWRITLPMLAPSLIGAALLTFIFSFAELEVSLFLISPGDTTLPVAMMDYATFKVDPILSALAAVQIALIAGLMLIISRFLGIGNIMTGGSKR